MAMYKIQALAVQFLTTTPPELKSVLVRQTVLCYHRCCCCRASPSGLPEAGRHSITGDKPIQEQIGSSFIQHYYQLFDKDRVQPGAIYIDTSYLTWEGQQFQGKAAIVEKWSSLPFQKIPHSITSQDHQPTPDSCILSMVVGQLKANEDPIMGFHQMFLLKNINDACVCTNDMFRLSLHNFS
ncbi:PREDICTED: nuclear transport factor 2-like [Elephantulus edwardii]|uniref:nuclear transport factor 2-like n=1 Tax=Elephantulus edwardii TaxID=28737 RepID=UPI0003F0E42E|nr:PREDICTED: nuclear transport factor 2-like [Elephantulus edwardii]